MEPVVGPVSYTHLIRSVAGQEVASAEQFREVLLQLTPKETYSVTVMPVSYTHLDVYKRQALKYNQKVTDETDKFRDGRVLTFSWTI